jgi:hypothetical protein
MTQKRPVKEKVRGQEKTRDKKNPNLAVRNIVWFSLLLVT